MISGKTAAVDVAGKFYSHQNVDTWYYHAYSGAISEGSSLPKNEVGSHCTERLIYGHIAVVRSGPADSTSTLNCFSKAELTRRPSFTRSRTQMVIFMERESRIHKGWDRYASGTQGHTITDFGL